MFRMHPNAEIGYLSTASTDLFMTIMVSEKGGGGGGGEEGSDVQSTIDELLEKLPDGFNEVEIRLRANETVFDVEATHAPYVLVVLQETRRMNYLTNYMKKTMSELKKGMNGELNMSQSMEHCEEALCINQGTTLFSYNIIYISHMARIPIFLPILFGPIFAPHAFHVYTNI